MNTAPCIYCVANHDNTPATQRIAYYHVSFGKEQEKVIDVCDSHASYVRLSYHVKSVESLPQAQHDVSYGTYRTAVATLFYGPDGWMALPQEYKRISLLAMLRACNGQQRLADKITAVLTIARYEGISLDEKE